MSSSAIQSQAQSYPRFTGVDSSDSNQSERFKAALRNIPIFWDFYAYFWAFYRKPRAHRGVFDSFQAAAAASPKGRPLGYNQDFVSDRNHSVIKRAEGRIGRFDSRDYPVLAWLAKAFEDSSTVLDLGGNVGLGYYAYSAFLRYPETLRWTVCEIEQFCREGRRLAAERNTRGLQFTETLTDGDGADIFLSCGSLQYIETPVADLISSLKHRPKHVLLQRVPLGNKPTFYTLENIRYAFCPYGIKNKRELIESLANLGYQLVADWKDTKECKIPFHPGRSVSGYHGVCFRLK